MIGQIAAVTGRMRVGSGGVMLPNHAPLMVAERFKMLEALFPGRIDLGIGRAPGTDPVTSLRCAAARAQRDRTTISCSASRNCCCSSAGFPDDHPFRNIRAMPADVALPPIWLLGSSGYSAELAAAVGMGFAFAHHFSDHDPVAAMRAIATSSGRRPPSEPYSHPRRRRRSADTDAEAERLATTVDLNFVRRAKGEYLPLASPEEAAAYPYSPVDRERIGRTAPA